MYDVVVFVVFLKNDGENGFFLIGVLGIVFVFLFILISFDIYLSRFVGVLVFGLIFIVDRVFINCFIFFFGMKFFLVVLFLVLFCFVDMIDSK